MVQIEPGTLDIDTIEKTVKTFINSKELNNLVSNDEYFLGRDTHIMHRAVPDDSGPDNRIPVSYARRIINIVVGYMYKPGLISYASDNQPYLDAISAVLEENREPIRTEQIGKQCSIHGVGYEYHWVDAEDATPRFCKLPATEVIPIYDFSVDPELWAFIRFYKKDDHIEIFVYDNATITEYWMDDKKGKIIFVGRLPHYYGEVPLVVFLNNEERLGDFDPIEPLIDVYDTLMSDSMNEFDRFAWAYLVLKGMSLTKENAAEIKRKRMFDGLDDEQAVSFLTKTIDSAFIKLMFDTIRAEIHRQSGIPNLDDYTFGGSASGETLDKFIYLMELFTDPKESYFREGLYQRIKLITTILNLRDGVTGEPREIDIVMNRNKPDSTLEHADAFNKYAGHLSERTLIENFAPFVTDVDEELKRLEEEKAVYDQGFNDESTGERKGDNGDIEAGGKKAQAGVS